MRLGPVRGRGDQGFDDKAFPGLSDDWMTEQRFLVPNSEQRMRDAAIAYIHLGRFYQPSADIAVPSRQSPNEQEVNKKVKITGDCLAIDTQTTGQIGSIKNLSLVMRQHCPEPPKRFRWYP